MADTSVLDPFSTRPRETAKINPRDQLGGSMEYVEELLGGTIDLILKGPQGSLVNEGPVTGASLEQLSQMPELKPGLPPSGSIEFTKRQVEIGQITRDVLQIHREQSIRPSIDQRREELNILLELNPSYLETMDNQGNSRKYYQSEADRKLNSQMKEKELKAQREAMRTQALGKSKSFMGENELLKGGENQNHWTKHVG